MNRSRVIGIVAASALAAATFTGVAAATAATRTADDTSQSPSAASPRGQEPGVRGPGVRGPGGHGPSEYGHGGPGGPGGPGGHRPEGDVLHAEAVIEAEDGTTATHRMQEGDVTEVSATSVTVTSTDGYTSTYVIDADTELDRDREQGTAPKLGDTVHVRAIVDGSTATADEVHALSPEAAKAMEDQRAQMQEWMSERPEGPAPQQG